MRRYWILGLISILAAATPALAHQCSGTTSLLGAGPSEGIAAVGELAAINAGSTVYTFDIADPARPQPLGELAFDDTVITVIPVGAIENFVLAFVYDEPAHRLALIDPSHQGSPRLVSSVEFADPLAPGDLAVIDSTAWIVTQFPNPFLVSIDLSDPERPRIERTIELPHAATSIAADGDQLLLASRVAGLMLVDVSDPGTPTTVGSLTIPNSVVVASHGNRAYVGTTTHRIHLVDISDPATPVEVSSVDYPYIAWPRDLAFSSGRLILGLEDLDPMIATPHGGLVVFDVSDPSAPHEIGYAPFSSGPNRLLQIEDATLVADGERGLRVFELEASGTPFETARRNITMDDAFAVAVRGDLAYLGDQGLRLIDISDHRNPIPVASVELDGEMTQVAVNEGGDRIAALSQRTTLHLFSADDPATPVLASTGPTDGYALAITGNVVGVVSGDEGLSLIDVSDPTAPEIRSSLQTSGFAVSIAMDGHLAVVGSSVQGGLGAMAVFDISDPADPVLLSQTPTQSGVYEVDLDQRKAVVSMRSFTVLYDLADPTSPIEIARYEDDTWTADGIALDGDRVHLSAWPGGLVILDFSNAISPRRVIQTWWHPLPIVDGGPLGGYDVAVHEGASVVADGKFGLRVFEVKRCIPETGPNQGSPTVD